MHPQRLWPGPDRLKLGCVSGPKIYTSLSLSSFNLSVPFQVFHFKCVTQAHCRKQIIRMWCCQQECKKGLFR